MTNVIDVNEPKVGMMFESYKQLLEYYTGYGKRLGFPVKIRLSTKGDDGELKYVTIAYSRSGKSKSTSKNPLKPHPKHKNCRRSESDAIGLVDGQPMSEAIDVLGTQENIGITNNLALLWGVTQRVLGNHFMDMHPVPCSSSKEIVDISELSITSSTSTSTGRYRKEEDRLVLQEEDYSVLCPLRVTQSI
ncbi:unnamed protein product [Ilex paraguariensis]|uniref:Protein FAR1-RELATED SEQUENCE n=1 Tax=Ilex paraguariensis TaxID=185542 RepID=A0ABC8RUH4_9AQUA